MVTYHYQFSLNVQTPALIITAMKAFEQRKTTARILAQTDLSVEISSYGSSVLLGRWERLLACVQPLYTRKKQHATYRSALGQPLGSEQKRLQQQVIRHGTKTANN